jgi:ubiquinone/menaquinone biosynthesis C-methylase UbiE
MIRVDRVGHAVCVVLAETREAGEGRPTVGAVHPLRQRLLDVACGAGLAIELAALRGATCAGIDASARLIAIASDRNPTADARVGDMCHLPWSDASFDVVTSFRGVWGTTPEAVAEIFRVLVPGGRVGITV